MAPGRRAHAKSRIESSNYDPSPAWSAGIQIAALNFQRCACRWPAGLTLTLLRCSPGKPLWVNQGRFVDNGGCGWVLKPKAMLDATPSGSEQAGEDFPGEVRFVHRWRPCASAAPA
jgi:phosphatidylinositol phospholipase C delta